VQNFEKLIINTLYEGELSRWLDLLQAQENLV
jgi:hypothetical protein